MAENSTYTFEKGEEMIYFLCFIAVWIFGWIVTTVLLAQALLVKNDNEILFAKCLVVGLIIWPIFLVGMLAIISSVISRKKK